MRVQRIISHEQILPLARAGLIFLKVASSIRIKLPDRANRWKHKSARRSASRFVRALEESGWRPRPILPPTLPPSLGLAVNETLPGSVSLTPHHHTTHTHTPVLVLSKPFSPLAVWRHPANCSDKGLSEGGSLYISSALCIDTSAGSSGALAAVWGKWGKKREGERERQPWWKRKPLQGEEPDHILIVGRYVQEWQSGTPTVPATPMGSGSIQSLLLLDMLSAQTNKISKQK